LAFFFYKIHFLALQFFSCSIVMSAVALRYCIFIWYIKCSGIYTIFTKWLIILIVLFPFMACGEYTPEHRGCCPNQLYNSVWPAVVSGYWLGTIMS